jgi:hypothetical protein
MAEEQYDRTTAARPRRRQDVARFRTIIEEIGFPKQ